MQKSFLATTKMFQGLPELELEALAKIVKLETYKKGETIFLQGDEGRGFFIVKSGKVKIFHLSGDGKEQILQFFEGGQHFAEVPAFDGGCFPVSAAAVENTEVLFFARDEFLKLLRSYPEMAINILGIFARHLRKLVGLIETISLKEVPARLAAYLLSLSDRQDKNIVELDITKGQLAAILGTIPETLSRGFTKLTQEGLIEVEGSSISILDKKGLIKRAGT